MKDIIESRLTRILLFTLSMFAVAGNIVRIEHPEQDELYSAMGLTRQEVINDENTMTDDIDDKLAVRMLAGYFEEMCIPKPFIPRQGEDFESHRLELKQRLLASVSLDPLPERIPLDIHKTESIDHPWCTVKRIYYQLWPGVYANGLLYVPKQFQESPAPAVLCPHGHFTNINHNPDIQKRCLFLAKLGYVVFSPVKQHYEDLSIGISGQTVTIWANMRAIDFLQTLPEVDPQRIGCCGCSGGGLQTQMLAALEPRIKAATDVGYTEDYRSVLFMHVNHCVCNHFPNVMRYTDQTEISALGMPLPIQYLVMNDQTRYFPYSHYPVVQDLYRINGASGKTDCMYYDTPHGYHRSKRERTYWWMERWLRGRQDIEIPKEPDEIQIFSNDTLNKLRLNVPENRGFAALSQLFRDKHLYHAPAIQDRRQWEDYCDAMTARLDDLLGFCVALPSQALDPVAGEYQERDGLLFQSLLVPSEAGLLIPVLTIRIKGAPDRLPMVLLCSKKGMKELLDDDGPDSAVAMARAGNLVVLTDPRSIGVLDWKRYDDFFQTKEQGEKILQYEHIDYLDSIRTLDFPKRFKSGKMAWERNSIVWGRPIPGMIATDLRNVLDAVLADGPADNARVKIITRGSADLAMGALFAAALDPRIEALDVDLQNCCFAKSNFYDEAGGLSNVSFILRHGDVLQWAALLADRKLILRNIPEAAGDTKWLEGAFMAAGNLHNLLLEK